MIKGYEMKAPLLAGVAAVALTVSGFAGTAQAQQSKPLTKEEVQTIIHDYIMENPQVIMESFEKFQRKQVEERMGKAKENITKFKKELTQNPLSPEIGNPKGDVTVVYFFDYNCGYCKRAFPTVTKLVEEDKKVRVVLKELPILGPSSELAAKYALAVNSIDKGKYFAYHSELMKFTGEKTEASLTEMAKKVGIKEDKLKEAVAKPEIGEYLNGIRQLAQDIGIGGTPAFVVGDELIPGAVDLDALKAKVQASRGGAAKQ